MDMDFVGAAFPQLLNSSPYCKTGNKEGTLTCSSQKLSSIKVLSTIINTGKLPYRTKVFTGINVREIRDCQNRERFKATKSISQQLLVAWKQHQSE